MVWLTRLALFIGLVATTADAHAWSASGPFRASIHGHVFDRLDITSTDCSLDLGLFFAAPPEAYADENPVRNVYRFRALVTLSDGKRFQTRVFRNRSAGRRKYLFSHDTTAHGCWASQEKTIIRVEVNGCRNRGCAVPGF